MNRIIFILTLSAFLFSQEAEVTNIQAAQRTDGSQIVDITYDLSEDAVFSVFTITVEVSLDTGYHSVIWNADNNASGVYFVKMVAGDFVNTQKLMLVK